MSAPPPSKPDRWFSRIRLSSRWVLCREGAALRLVPKFVGQTFGITQAKGTRLMPPPVSPRGHSCWFVFPSVCPSHFHLPASLGSTVVTRFSATIPTSRIRATESCNLFKIKARFQKVFTTRAHLAVTCAAVILGGGCSGNFSFSFSSNSC